MDALEGESLLATKALLLGCMHLSQNLQSLSLWIPPACIQRRSII